MGHYSRSPCVMPAAACPDVPKVASGHDQGLASLQNDRVEHRLHCHVDDCVRCRCDSGSTMPSPSSSFSSPPISKNVERAGNDRHARINLRHCCRLLDATHDPQLLLRSTSSSSSSSSFVDGTSTSASHSRQRHRTSCCEHCQYSCCVCTLNCRSIASDPVMESTSVSTSFSHHVCSSTTCSVATDINAATSTSTTTTATSPTLCTCPSWKLVVATVVQPFMSLLSGRLRRPHRRRLLNSSTSIHRWQKRMTSLLCTLITVATFCLSFLPISDACSSRSTPKPRPPSPTLRPNITIDTFSCPEEYEKHYCLNNAKCFVVKIGEAILYNCECAEGYMGQRCEFKDLDGSYLPSKQRAMLEQAGLTSTAAIIVVLVVIVCFYLYVRSRRKLENSQRNSGDVPDGLECVDYETERLPFSGYYYLNRSPPNLSHNGQI